MKTLTRLAALALVALGPFCAHADLPEELEKASKARCWEKKTLAEKQICYDQLYADESINTQVAKQWRKHRAQHVAIERRRALRELAPEAQDLGQARQELSARGCPERVLRSTPPKFSAHNVLRDIQEACYNFFLQENIKASPVASGLVSEFQSKGCSDTASKVAMSEARIVAAQKSTFNAECDEELSRTSNTARSSVGKEKDSPSSLREHNGAGRGR